MRPTLIAPLACVAWLAGCGDDSGTNGNLNNNHQCAQGFVEQGPACVPVYDECPGPAEIAVLGGGCMPVGVTQCATGFVSDDEGGCDPILPSEVCPDGSMELLGMTDCQPVGVRQCGPGFAADGRGGCEPVLPENPCPTGTMEILGHADCQPISDCGSGTWGNIVTDATTVYVDISYPGGDSDGSDASPFTTITEALAAVQPGGQIAVAGGEYTERLTFNIPVHLHGRCADLVTIRGTSFLGQDRPPITLNTGGSGSIIRGVTLTGDDAGLMIVSATGVVVEQVRVLSAGRFGVAVQSLGQVTLRRTVVEDCSTTGVVAEGGSVTMDQCVVRDTRPQPSTNTHGIGVEVQCESSSGVCGTLSITGSVITRNTSTGVSIWGVPSSVEFSALLDTRPQPSDGRYGRGLSAYCHHSLGTCSTLAVNGCYLAGNTDGGVVVSGLQGTIESTVVRDNHPRANLGDGWGVAADCFPYTGTCARLEVRDSLIGGVRSRGIYNEGADVQVVSTIVRSILPDLTGEGGWGIDAVCDAVSGSCGHMEVAASLVEANADAGIVSAGVHTSVASTVVRYNYADSTLQSGWGLFGGCIEGRDDCGSLTVSGSILYENTDAAIIAAGLDATIIGTVVRDTLAETDDHLGIGIVSHCDNVTGKCGTLEVTGCLVDRNRYDGIYTDGVHATVTSTVVRDTRPHQTDGSWGRGIEGLCDPVLGTCGSLTVSDSLVERNRDVGIYVAGEQGAVDRTIVRDTLAHEALGAWGVGIGGQCHPEAFRCSSLVVTSSLISGNRLSGIFSSGTQTAVGSTTVRDTLPQESDGMFGRGIAAQCDPVVFECGSLAVQDSIVKSSETNGVFVAGVPAVLAGTAVFDTRPNQTGDLKDDYGQAVMAMCDTRFVNPICSTVNLFSCVVQSAAGAGLAVQGTSGFAESSAFLSISPRPLDGGFGYGMQVEGVAEGHPVNFDIRSCSIRNAALAGILYFSAGGTVTGTETSGAPYALVATVGSDPTVADDNRLEGTERGGLYWGNFSPSPAPPPMLPTGP